jgi:Domain of unknown function (DUF6456)
MNPPSLCFDQITPAVVELLTHPKAKTRPHPILEGTSAAWFLPPHRAAAATFTEWCAVAADDPTSLGRAAEVLHPWTFTGLALVCGCRFGVERTEKIMAWPARSGKIMLALGLDQLIRAGTL